MSKRTDKNGASRLNPKVDARLPEAPLVNLPLISLFSGAGGLDIGLEQSGLNLKLCVEVNKDCCNTLRLNLPSVEVICDDIRKISTEAMLEKVGSLEDGLFCLCGGPPCQSFSSGGKRASIMDPRGSLFMEYLRVVREARPSYFVFENVANIVTAAIRHRPIAERPGQNWNLSAYSNGGNAASDEAASLDPDEMSGSAIAVILEEFDKLGYYLTYGVLNSADFGAPQRRLRFVIIGSREGVPVRLPAPTHSVSGKNGLPKWRTLRDALKGLTDENSRHSNYTEAFRSIFELIPPGGNWRSLPEHIQRIALGNGFESGGGKTGFFRRLAWDEPSPTIVAKPNRKSCAICHPDEIRPLTVRECARVQGFPDSWTFTGSMHPQYMQIGNAVPVALGRAIGRAIIEAHNAAAESPMARQDVHSWKHNKDAMLHESKTVLRQSARNKVVKKASAQLSLYAGV